MKRRRKSALMILFVFVIVFVSPTLFTMSILAQGLIDFCLSDCHG